MFKAAINFFGKILKTIGDLRELQLLNAQIRGRWTMGKFRKEFILNSLDGFFTGLESLIQ